MAEILLRVRDKTNPTDPYKDCKLTKRGDVICVQNDGWTWGVGELLEPFWRIVKLSSASAQQFEDMLGPELPTDATPSRMLQRRAFKYDLDAPTIPADIRAYLDDDSRVQPFIVLSGLRANAFRALKIAKPRLADPQVIA